MIDALPASILLALIAVIGLAAQWLAWSIKIPAIVLLLLCGILIGPVAGVLDPDALFGDLLFDLVSLGVAIILFEGALTLKLHQIKGLQRVVWRLCTVGALITLTVMAVAVHLLLDFAWPMAILFGALVSVTGPTVIVPLLRTVRPNQKISKVLKWEGIIIDPFGALFAVLAYEVVVSGLSSHFLWTLSNVLVVGTVTGLVAGYGAAWPLRRHAVPEYLVNFFVFAIVIGVFVLANTLAHEAGLLAVTVMGMVMANVRGLDTEDILNFKETLTVMLISGLFILLAARIDIASFVEIGFAGFALLAIAMLIARPLTVLVSSFGSDLSWQERAMIAWIGPRGIVAAAVSALFALKLGDAYPGANLLVPLTFSIIIGTVVIQSLSARPIAEWLGVAEPAPNGVLIAGGNRFAIELGKALKNDGFRVMLCDGSWETLSQARFAGLETYYGNPVSAHADQHLDLVGIGQLLAISRRPAFNALACQRYRGEFGATHVFRVRHADSENFDSGQPLPEALNTPFLIDGETTLAKLLSLVGGSEGYQIRSTNLSDSFTLDDYRKTHPKAIPIYAVSPSGQLQFFAEGTASEPAKGWRIGSLLPRDQDAPPEKSAG
ncbi:sodium:proton antiporter [Gammaproteobacteria bacterium]|nr:sodium:proton antiporter [Gammaproteobacteria bacterium]